MNRIDFMRQLESLLQNIAPGEREEALQYYNDYFDDAGWENEQEVIEALGNPARVAESIKRDLLGSGYGEGVARKALASDRALMKYGEGGRGEAKEPEQDGENRSAASAGGGQDTQDSLTGGGQGEQNPYVGGGQGAQNPYAGGQGEQNPYAGGGQDPGNLFAGSGGRDAQNPFAGSGGRDAQNPFAGGSQDTGNSYTGGGQDAQNSFGGFGQSGPNPMEGNSPYAQGQEVPGWDVDFEKPAKSGLPPWAIALLVTVSVLFSPAILGLAVSGIGVLLSLFVAWFCLIFSFGAASLCLLVMLVLLVIVGVMCIPANPWVGMTLIGSGLICGSLGILFLMLTVAVGATVPAICRGLASLFRRKKSARG